MSFHTKNWLLPDPAPELNQPTQSQGGTGQPQAMLLLGSHTFSAGKERLKGW